MQKITLILEKDNTPITGGQKYDLYFVDRLKKKNIEMQIISDSNFKYSKYFPSYFYNLFYLTYFSILSRTDILIINSRLYPRVYYFLYILKFFSKKNLQIFTFHHHYNFMTHQGWKRKIHKFFEKNFLKKMSLIILPSKYVLSITKEILPKVKSEFIEIAFAKNTIETKSKELSKNLVFVGKIEHRKGLHLLIESLKYIDIPCKVHLIGTYNSSDPYYLNLQKQIEISELKSSIIFHGRLESKKMDTILQNSSIFVFPSLHEGYGMVMMEAMAFGLPIVAFNNSSIPFVIKNNHNGLISKNMDVEDFAFNIKKILENKDFFKSLSDNAKMTFQECRKYEDLHIDIDKFYTKYLA